VVVAVLDGDTHTLETLASVARTQVGDWELVIVVSSSGDAPAQAAVRWARANPRLATTVVTAPTSTSRGAARNVAVDLARGEFLLVMDPGGSLRGHGMRRLSEVLSVVDGATFVYPMIEISGDRDWFAGAGGDSLLNTGEWDPANLRLGNPVFAPYLIRTASVRELGGFAADTGLEGFEDYDLWARIAETGGRGQLLAQVLAGREERPGSRALATLRLGTGPVSRALAARSPHAMAGATAAVP
jgi:hypothetical protein